MSQPAGKPLRLSVTLEGAMFPVDQQWRLLEAAREADALGVDMVDVTEHVLLGLAALEQGHGWERHHLDMVQTEPLLTLAAMAGATQRVQLLSAVVIAPLRPAGLLAKQAATLHALSRGRFVMGVSVSWQQAEYDALGVPFHRRGQVLDDNLGACRALWEGAPASFHSPTVNFDGMFCQPRPLPGERIPIWFGGEFGPRLIRRVVTLGDGWMPYGGLGLSLAQKAEANATLREQFAAAGRGPATLDVCDEVPPINGDVARSMEQIPDIVASGATVLRVHLRRFSTTPDDVLPALREIARRFEAYRSIRV